MKKIPTLFQRNYESDRLVRDEVTPGCEWVLAGEGIPTVKLDGTACAVIDGRYYKRYELKKGKQRPLSFVAAQEPDPVTGDIPGWVPVDDLSPADTWHSMAMIEWFSRHESIPDGTYELIGAKVQGNPYRLPNHVLLPHAQMDKIPENPRTFEEIWDYLRDHEVEGIVWHHPDGRMVKIKRRDFGYKWPEK